MAQRNGLTVFPREVVQNAAATSGVETTATQKGQFHNMPLRDNCRAGLAYRYSATGPTTLVRDAEHGWLDWDELTAFLRLYPGVRKSEFAKARDWRYNVLVPRGGLTEGHMKRMCGTYKQPALWRQPIWGHLSRLGMQRSSAEV
jgi:hypothetical protein